MAPITPITPIPAEVALRPEIVVDNDLAGC